MRRAMREIIRLSTEWDAVVAALGPHAHPGLSPSESVAEVVAALEQAQAMYETSHASRVHADGCVLRLEAERDALRAELDRPKHETLRQLADAVERNAALKAERDALRLAVAKLEDERKFWAGGDAMARLKANDLRAEVERLERARLRSGDWLTLDKLDAEVAAAKDGQIEALRENVDLLAEVSRSHAAILALTGEVASRGGKTMSTHVAPELLEEAKRLREALREIEQATEGIPEQNCMIANRIARLTLGDARAAAAEGFFARGDDGQYRTDPAPGCPHGSPAGSARDCACNEPDVPCNHQWVPAQFCIKCGLQGFPEPAPTLERHWQDDADHDPGRAQTAYQAEQTRVAEGTVGGIKTLNPWAQGEVGRVVAERAALRVAMGETPQEQWQEMAARVARAEDRTMSAEAERDALREMNAGHPTMCCGQCGGQIREAEAEVERLRDWQSVREREIDAVMARFESLNTSEYQRGRAEEYGRTCQERERWDILLKRAEAERDGSVGWRCAQEQRIRAEKAEAALRRIAEQRLGEETWDELMACATGCIDEARTALRDTAPPSRATVGLCVCGQCAACLDYRRLASVERHWQDDADTNPGRAQAAYQAEVERGKP